MKINKIGRSQDDTVRNSRVCTFFGRKTPKRPLRPKIRRGWLAGGILAVIVTVVLIPVLQLTLPVFRQYPDLVAQMDAIVAGQYNVLRTAPLVVTPGLDLDAAHFLDRLRDLGYVRNKDANVDAGQFYIDANKVYIATQGTDESPSMRVVINVEGAVVRSIATIVAGSPVASVSLEGHVLTSFSDQVWELRFPLRYKEFPPSLINALLATEDRDFFRHPGVDLKALVRAAIVNYQEGEVVQGGSTVTQQLVKVLTGRKERVFAKKYQEALLALALEARYSKEEILTAYLNNVYLGKIPPYEIRGMGAAARMIFAKDIDKLSLTECAVLAGLVRSPHFASPLSHPEGAANRAKTVLKQLAALGDEKAASIKVGARINDDLFEFERTHLAYFLGQLEKELVQKRYLPQAPGETVTINVTLDPWMQAAAEKALVDNLDRYEKPKGHGGGALQGAVVILDPKSGEVRAAVGGRDFVRSRYNRVFAAQRQIGSLIKPFIYLTALGGADVHGRLTQSSLVVDQPHTVGVGKASWTPQNYDNKYCGTMTVRKALAQSRNIPAVKVGMELGNKKLIQLLRDLGVNRHPNTFPSLFLGACESTPLRMAVAYSAIANGGSLVEPTLIRSIVRRHNIEWQPDLPKPLLSSAPCFVMTDMLRSAVRNGTGHLIVERGFSQEVAGKTGTTNDMNDAWFAGYTPSLVTVVWLGRDDNKEIGLTGATGALPIWLDAMREIVGKQQGNEQFVPPKGVVMKSICSDSGLVASGWCPQPEEMAFVQGTEPGKTCQQYVTPVAKIQEKPKQGYPHSTDDGRKAGNVPKKVTNWLQRVKEKFLSLF